MINLELEWRNCETDEEHGPFHTKAQIKKAIRDIIKVVDLDQDEVEMQVAFKDQTNYRLLRFEHDGTNVIITSDVDFMGFFAEVPDKKDKEKRERFYNLIIDAIKFIIERVDY